MAEVDSTSFGAVVNKCSDAVEIDNMYGLTSYINEPCNSDAEADIYKIQVYYKSMT